MMVLCVCVEDEVMMVVLSAREREVMMVALCAHVECEVVVEHVVATVPLCARVERAVMMVVQCEHVEREHEIGLETLRVEGSKLGLMDVESEAPCLHRCQACHHVHWRWVHYA